MAEILKDTTANTISTGSGGLKLEPSGTEVVTINNGIMLPDGTKTEPAVRFTDDNNTGIYSPTNDQIAVTGHGENILVATGVAGSVNAVEVKSSTTGVAVEINAVGTDADVSINVNPKGTGTFTVAGTPVSTSSHTHTGVYEPANANIQSHIGSTSNPHGTTAAQVGAYTTTQTDTLLSGKSDTTHNHTGVYEPADATILKDADIGVTVQAYDATILVDADIGVSVAAQGHNHDLTYINLTEKGAALGVATLGADSKIPSSQLPAIAITDTTVVTSQASMLALTAQIGDVAVRSDLNKSFILAGTDPTVLGNWQELLAPTDAVLSVDGQTGAVSLSGVYSAIGHNHDASYVSIVSTPTVGNFPTLNVSGELDNSAYSAASFASAVHTHTTTDVSVHTLGAPTNITTADDAFDYQWSAGVVSGCAVTDNGNGTVAVSAGEALLRLTSTPSGDLVSMVIPASPTVALTDGAVNYIYADYNAGVPTVQVATSTTAYDCLSKCIIAYVFRSGTDLTIYDQTQQNVDANRSTRRRFIDTENQTRVLGGSVIGSASALTVSVTSGAAYRGLKRYDHAAVDTSVSGSFTYWYRNGAGGWTSVVSSTSIDNLQYDNGSGTLATLANNNFGVHWAYIVTASNKSTLHIVYGQSSYTSTTWQTSQAPTALPPHLQISMLLGRYVVAKSGTTFTAIQSAFNNSFGGSSVSAHNDLSGIQGGAVNDYYHMTSAQQTSTLSHLTDTANPHSVTAAQVGAYTTAQVDTLLTGKSDTSHTHTGVYQPVDGDLTAIASLAGTSGILTKTATDTWSLDTNTYSTTAHSHTLDGLSDVTITTPASGNVLSYNGSAWVNSAPAGGGADSRIATNPSTPAVAPVVGGTGVGQMAIGDGAVVSGTNANGLAIGYKAFASGVDSIAIGNKDNLFNSGAFGAQSIAIGRDAKSTQTACIAIGDGAIAANTYNLSLGHNANCTANATYGVALGDAALSNGFGGVVIGKGAFTGTGAGRCIAIGVNANANSSGSIAIGGDNTSTAARALSSSAIAIGDSTTASGSRSVCLGSEVVASGTQAIRIGNGSGSASGANTIVIGQQSSSSGTASIAVGLNLTVDGNGTIAIGDISTGSRDYNIAIGKVIGGVSTAGGICNNVVVLGTGAHYNCASEISFATGSCTTSQYDTPKSGYWYNWYKTTSATQARLGGITGVTGTETPAAYTTINDNQVVAFETTLLATRTGATNATSFTIKGLIKRGAAAANTAFIGTPTITQDFDDSSGLTTGSVSVVADTTNGSYNILVTGIAATNIRWYANTKFTAIQGTF